ncbi:MAG: GHKL domain-containing protein [Ruminococcaceae bacterium]|nr:GHKL domain-containing protein [Oscillospiraceae bacterium]
MKSYKKSLLFFMLAILFIVSINSAIFYYTACIGSTVKSTDCYGQTYETDKETVSQIISITEKYGDNYVVMAQELHEEWSVLSELLYNLRELQKYGSTLEEVKKTENLSTEKKEMINNLISYYGNEDVNIASAIENISKKTTIFNAAVTNTDKYTDYDSFIKSVSDNADFMLEISIYKNDLFAVNNIEKTKSDYNALSGLSPKYADDSGLSSFLNYRITDIIAILSVLLLLPFFAGMIKSADSTLTLDRRYAVIFPLILTGAVIVMQGANLLFSVLFIGKIDISLPVQSYPILFYSGEKISTGLLILHFFLSKIVGTVIFLLLTSSLVCIVKGSKGAKKLVGSLAIILFVVFEAVTVIFMGDGNILKELNIFSCFMPERYFIRYINVDILGNAVSRTGVFWGFALAVLLISLIVFIRSLGNFMKIARADAEQSYYDEINRKYEQSRAIRHDINNHLTVISMLIEKGDSKGALKYINEVFDETSLAMQPLKTGSSVLDALLHKKTEQASKSNITLSYEVNASLNVGISDYDMCVIFGNILDNAIEAAKKADEDKRDITLTVGTQHDMLYISCHNFHSNDIKEQGDRLMTTKSDTSMHGIGLSRIKTVAAKYGGTVKVSYDEANFMIEVLIHKIK